eukprot:387235-Rhodomonas_salina.1
MFVPEVGQRNEINPAVVLAQNCLAAIIDAKSLISLHILNHAGDELSIDLRSRPIPRAQVILLKTALVPRNSLQQLPRVVCWRQQHHPC